MAQRVAAERRLADAEDEVLAVRQELAAIHREEGRLRFDLGELEKMRKAL